MRAILALMMVAAPMMLAQDGTTVNISPSPPARPWTKLLFMDGSSNLEYRCVADANQPVFTWTKAATTLTSIAVAANVGTVTFSGAHGLAVGNSVTVSGGTVAGINASYYVQTVPTSSTLTITTAGVGDDTYTESTLVVTSAAPRSTAAIWTITKFSYTGTNVVRDQSSAHGQVCDNRAVTTGATKIIYQ